MTERQKRESAAEHFAGWWKRLSAGWKAAIVASGLVGFGAAGQQYLDRYATKDSVSVIRSKVDQLAETSASMESSIQAIQKTTDDTKESIRTLLQHVLNKRDSP